SCPLSLRKPVCDRRGFSLRAWAAVPSSSETMRSSGWSSAPTSSSLAFTFTLRPPLSILRVFPYTMRPRDRFPPRHEDAIRDPGGGIGGWLAIRDHLKLLCDGPGFEEEFADFLEEEDGAVGGFHHEFDLCFPPCAFMAAGSPAERERFKPRKRTPTL